MEKYCDPNIPSGRVKRAFISEILPDAIVSELNDLGIRTYKLGKSEHLYGELKYHPDMLINNYKTGLWLCENDAKYLPKELPADNMFIETNEELGELYPYDCLFNTFRIGNTVFCGKRASYGIKFNCEYEGLDICYVPQGYTKCATILVSSEACITCDKSIYEAMRRLHYDMLLLPDSTGIHLNGFSSGLIGGCAGLIDKNVLAFTGNLQTYKYGDDIIDFCKNHNVDAMSLTNEEMYDYGGIMPISELYTEEDDI